MDKKEQLTFEEALAKLEACAAKIRSGELSLEESIKAYEESKKYYGICEAVLKEARQKIEIYDPASGKTEDFDEQ